MSQPELIDRSLISVADTSVHDAFRLPRPTTPTAPHNHDITLDSVFTASSISLHQSVNSPSKSPFREETVSRSGELMPRSTPSPAPALRPITATPREVISQSHNHMALLERSINITTASSPAINKGNSQSKAMHLSLPHAPAAIPHEHISSPPSPRTHIPPTPADNPIVTQPNPLQAEVDILRAKLAAAEAQNLALQSEITRLEDRWDRFLQDIEDETGRRVQCRELRDGVPAAPYLPDESHLEGLSSSLSLSDWWLREGRKMGR